ncbi:MAG: NADPH-dependent reductase [Marmoricola sp.]|nr:NADPH-dependent reductase [Marmoricola sp.]
MTLKLADDSQSPDVRRIAVVTAGLSEPSSTRLLADLLGEATKAALLEGARDAEIEVVELRPLAHAITDALLTGFPTGDLAAAVESVASADAVIAVTPVFSASFSGLFKMFFDVLEPGTLDGMPVLVAATAGSARHSLVLDHALRPLFSYLHAVVVPTAVFAASEDWGANGVAGDLRTRVDRAAGELADLVVRRPALHRVDPFGDVPDFASMLGS